ncbi:chromate transporter [Formivibrio citricus]|uniref:Chromate transporter n=1 Tax=Formivibrio citricus TaxID=83765 RepID=A0A1I5C713_9NEIS|nr:chromate transporter [Formivibrio citricus]SFN82727.1 chromate transporter [Formivibrio citricus]
MNEQEATVHPSRLELFAGFFQIGMAGFGGVMPHARRALVEKYCWFTEKEFIDLLGLGQFLPGPNVGNIAIVAGARFHGWIGSVLALTGLFLAPFVIVLLLASLYRYYDDSVVLNRALAAVAAAAAGLLLATALKMVVKLERRAWVMAMLGLTFVAIFWLRLPLLGILAVLTPVSLGLGWYALRKESKQ